jgi:hypothetical protein
MHSPISYTEWRVLHCSMAFKMRRREAVMTDRTKAVTKTDRAQAAFAGNRQAPASLFNPLMPWLNPGQWWQAEYLIIEIQLQGSEARIRGERTAFRDGVVSRETVDARAPLEHYVEAVDQLQQQTLRMMQAMLLPWAALMQPFIPKDLER